MGGDDNRAMTATAPLPVSDSSLPEGAVRLTDWGLIRAQGEDAATFLQGQLTNDVKSLREGEARLAGYCSAKGRLLASFTVWKLGADDFLLACSADLLPPTLKRLSMFLLRAKCRLTDASAEFPLWGLAGPSAQVALGEAAPATAWGVARHGAASVVRLPDVSGLPRFLLAASGDALPVALPALPMSVWRWLEVASGVVRIVGATVEQFVPQMVNLELVGGVSFKKGCYPGQEVVARSQYRGTLKRRGALLSSVVAMSEGQEVFQAADPGQPAGTVALAASLDDAHHLALVEIKRAALGLGGLHLGQADGPPLASRDLPYEVPQDEH